MLSIYTAVFTLALLAEHKPLAASMVVGLSKLDEGRGDGDGGLSLLLGDEQPPDDLMQGIPTQRRLSLQDNRLGDEDGAPRIIILSVSVFGVCRM